MKFTEFKARIKDFPIYNTNMNGILGANAQKLSNQITRWHQKGLLIPLRRGIYILNEQDRIVNPSLFFIANTLYTPSYVSLEYALSHYSLIPEKVTDITSVTPMKTQKFVNVTGVFIYKKIKHDCFQGYLLSKDVHAFPSFLATPEKAVIDFIYFRMSEISEAKEDVFQESYRFQNTEILSKKSLKLYAKMFKSKKLVHLANIFIETVC